MNVFLKVLGALASLLTISLFISERLRVLLLPWVPRLLGLRYRHPWSMDEINRAIARAHEEIAIMQTWVPTLNADIGQWQKLSRGVRCRILLANDSIVTARLRYRPHTVPLTDSNLRLLSRFNSEHDTRFEVKLYRGLAFGPIYIVDDVVYWGIYLANRDSMMGPRFRCSRFSRIGKMITESFESVWEMEGFRLDGSGDVQGAATVEIEQPGGLPDEPAPSDRELVTAANSHSTIQRYCAQCDTWLSYRSVGPDEAAAVESFCPNPQCSRYGETVNTLHVS